MDTGLKMSVVNFLRGLQEHPEIFALFLAAYCSHYSSWELGWINSNITIPGFTVRFICQRERALILLD